MKIWIAQAITAAQTDKRQACGGAGRNNLTLLQKQQPDLEA